ncbi:enoyl-CoA hydratase-related protein [Peribacillus sp. SCS-26]|uniref:enoyl-CoA hydratase-related protein n=1 Tax=Paraperibacillus marinus TaxID=3115295 RepID=UPI0039066A87
MGRFVTYEKKNNTAVVVINNPPLNVLERQVFEELLHTFQELASDSGITAVLLTGSGSKAFVAGADIKEFPGLMENPDMLSAVMETHGILNYIAGFPKPTIGVLNGLTLGGGLELALTLDIRIAEEQVLIGLPEVKLGLFPGGGGTQRLSRLVGASKAKEMMFTGDTISASEALDIGLVNQVAPEGEGIISALKIAGRITPHSLQALSRIKFAVDKGSHLPLQEGIELEARLFQEVFQTEDIKEGVGAFLEKRKPIFKHR